MYPNIAANHNRDFESPLDDPTLDNVNFCHWESLATVEYTGTNTSNPQKHINNDNLQDKRKSDKVVGINNVIQKIKRKHDSYL